MGCFTISLSRYKIFYAAGDFINRTKCRIHCKNCNTLHVMPSAINVTTGPGVEVFENKGEWLLSWIICSTWLESEFPPRYSFSGAVRLALFLVTLHWWWSIFGVIYREGGKHYGAYPRSALTETRFYPRPTQPQPHQIQRELFKAHLEMRHTTIPKYVSRIFMLIKCISFLSTRRKKKSPKKAAFNQSKIAWTRRSGDSGPDPGIYIQI